jgi:hypothetical protein
MDDLQEQLNLMLYLILQQSFLDMVELCFQILMIVSASHSSIWFYKNQCIKQQPMDREGLWEEFLESLINTMKDGFILFIVLSPS